LIEMALGKAPKQRNLQARLAALIGNGRGSGLDDSDQAVGELWRYCLSLTRNPEAADDLAQETALRAARGLDGFKPKTDGDALRAWLFKIAKRQFQTNWRARAEETDTVELDERVWTPDVGPEPAAGSGELMAAMSEVLAAHKLTPYEQNL